MEKMEQFMDTEERMQDTAVYVSNGELSEAELSGIAGGCWFKVCRKCREKRKEKKKTPWYLRLIRKESNKYEELLNSL